jgi:hypothetical protein
MRGAQPDAVCPRCDHHQPPSDSPLAHCKQCGLTFQPKELFVSSKRPTRIDEEEPVFDAALVVSPPKSLTIDETDDEIAYAWTNNPRLFGYIWFVCGCIALLLWLSDVALNDKVGYTIGILVVALAAFFQSKPSVKLRVAKRHLRSGRGMLLLSELQRVELEGSRLFAITREDKRLLVVDVDDREIGAYLHNTLAKRFGDLAREKLKGDDK